MLLAEIVPAFQGISMKLVPNSVPALDCPVLFPYAPNAVIFGFVFTTIGSIIGMFLTPVFGLPMVLPGVLSNFFAGGTAHGIFITFLPAMLSPMLADIGFINTTCTDVDTVVTGFLFMLFKSIAAIF